MRYVIKFEDEVNAESPEEAARLVIERLRLEEFTVSVFEGEGEDEGEWVNYFDS